MSIVFIKKIAETKGKKERVFLLSGFVYFIYLCINHNFFYFSIKF
nr:MAG TPA: hypothetical protein [Caudoviricetes sp.]